MRRLHRMLLQFSLGVVLAIGLAACTTSLNRNLTPSPEPSPNPSTSPSPDAVKPGTPGIGGKACTLEAKVCADGSAVGRTGPNCEFAACPGEKSAASPAPVLNPNTK